MPKNLAQENVPLGTIAHQWVIPEYHQYDRTRAWYMVMIMLGVALLAYALITGNNSFAVIIVLLGVIMYLYQQQEPLELNVALTDSGLVLGKKLYRYSELDSFWIIYEPGEVKSLYCIVQGLVKNRLAIPLGDTDPVAVRQFLAQFVVENTTEEDEPLSDKLTRVFKIQ